VADVCRAVALCLALTACHRDASANLEQGDRLMALGQFKQAIVEYQTALNLEANPHAQRGLGLAYEALAAFAQAQRYLEATLEAKPGDAEARVALARVSTRFGHYDRARSLLLAALDQNPDNDAALLLFGVYADTPAQLQQAIDQLEAQAERQRSLGHSSSHEAQLVLADLMARNNRQEAADKLREGIRYAPLGNTRLTLELARASAERDNHELARQLLLPLVEKHPDEKDAWQVLAVSALELGHIGEARAAMKQLADRATEPGVRLLHARLGLASGLETEPIGELRSLLGDLPEDAQHERARVRLCLARALVDQRRDDEAEVQLRALLVEHPEDVEGSMALAELQLRQGKSEQTLQLLSGLTDQQGQPAHAYQILGRAYLQLGQLSSAEQAFRRLWELAPQQPEARHWLAISLWRRGQTDQARRLLEGNLKRFPAHQDSLMALADLLEESAGIAPARAFMLAHGQQYSDLPDVANVEASWLMAHRDPEHALAAYRRALMLDPSSYPAVSALTRFYAGRDRNQLASSVIDAALAHDSSDLRLFLLGARTAEGAGRYDQAREYCERALREYPEHPLAVAELGVLWAEGFRDLPRARELVAKAYAAAPTRPEVLDAMGWVTHLGGDSLGALPDLERAVQAVPDDSRAVYHLGATLLATGQIEAANQQLSRVLSLDPAFPTAKEIRFLLSRNTLAHADGLDPTRTSNRSSKSPGRKR
jgi:tetratricopeptide (TPR) repeat protein